MKNQIKARNEEFEEKERKIQEFHVLLKEKDEKFNVFEEEVNKKLEFFEKQVKKACFF